MNSELINCVSVIPPFEKPEVCIELLPTKEAEALIAEGTYKFEREIKGLFNRSLYRSAEGKHLMSYAVQFYVLLDSEKEYESVARTEDHDLISLVYDKIGNRFYISFSLYSSGIAKMLRKNHSVVEGYGRKIYGYDEGKQIVKTSKAVRFDDGSMLIYNERAPSVYSGRWCQDFENFEYLYKNEFL
jgi:hypothetical protein